MRRIPRPLQAIEPPRPLLSLCRPCRSALGPWSSPAGPTFFSTSAARSFILPAGKQDKKKHQQFVRRWQKRILGDSEPIGAHVDPYDPMSPVRIAPEEQGEYEEVLEEAADSRATPSYRPAKHAKRLPRVGDKQWLQRRLEGDLAREFEKLTLRTYTPLSLEMASEIEVLTGTPYTLRDENLLLAQRLHNTTGRPYTHYNFGMQSKATTPRQLRARFERAVAEVFALRQAGLDMDLSKFTNNGVYDAPRWVKDIKLYQTDSGELALAFPKYKSAEQFLQIMQSAPSLDESIPESDELLVDGAEAEASGLLEPVSQQEQLPTMDPETPAFKRAAVIKVDSEKKPFDFMSNRPVPRAKPVEQSEAVEAVDTEVSEVSEVPKMPKSVEDTAAVSSLPESTSPQSTLETASQNLESVSDLSNLEAHHQRSVDASPAISDIEEVKWRDVPITDITLKFALFKRLLQLTAIRISDPHLSASHTLGDLYGHLCAAAKPQPKSLFTAIHVEGQRARVRAKQLSASEAAPRQKVDLGDLINLGNVEIRRTKPTKIEKNTKLGRDKVVQYALWERGLYAQSHASKARRNKNKKSDPIVPDFGRPLSSEGADYLAKMNGRLQQ